MPISTIAFDVKKFIDTYAKAALSIDEESAVEFLRGYRKGRHGRPTGDLYVAAGRHPANEHDIRTGATLKLVNLTGESCTISAFGEEVLAQLN